MTGLAIRKKGFRVSTALVLILFMLFAGQSSKLLQVSPITVIAQPIDGIIEPRIGYPAFILSNGSMDVKMVRVPGSTSWRAALSNELWKGELLVENVSDDLSENTTKLRLRAERIPAGLYGLELVAMASTGQVMVQRREPSSVSVRENFALPLRVMWVTDVHIDESPAQVLNFRRIVRLANFLRPDLVALTGDVVNDPKRQNFPMAHRLMQELEVPIVLTPGNHDHAVEGNFFEQYLAPWYGSLNVGPIHLVTLDTGSGSIVGELNETQLAWLDRDLTVNERAKFKILLWHHPMFDVDNPSNQTAHVVYQVAKKHRVDLILNGHLHADKVFKGPVLTLVNPNNYPGGRPYTGFRILTVSDRGIDYKYAGTENTIPLYDFDIDYSQPNDGKSYGVMVNLANRWTVPVQGVLRLRVKVGDFIKIEGGEVGLVEDTATYLIVNLIMPLQTGERRAIKAYTRVDTDPPAVGLVEEPSVKRGPTANLVEFRFNIYDEVLGVESAEIRYSIDNRTWFAADLIQVEPRIFWCRIQLEKSTPKLFYYARARDMDGRTRSSELRLIVITEEPTSTSRGFPTGEPLALGFLVLGLALLTVIALNFWRRRISSSLALGHRSRPEKN